MLLASRSLLVRMIFTFILFFVFPSALGAEDLILKKECEKIGGVEVRYNEFYELYLGHSSDNKTEIYEKGLIYQSFNHAVDACCPGMKVNYTLVDQSVEYLVQEDILRHHRVQNSSHLVFYFPEFTSQGNLEVYSHRIPFLKLRKSPGYALVMLKSESHLDISAIDIMRPSWPIFALIFLLSWAVGITVWAFEHRFNPDEFPKPFYRGMFEAFWWAVVTMTTVGYGDKTPKSIISRVLCMVWILAGAVLLSLFTANTTSIITASRIEQNAQTMGKKIGVVNMKQFVEAELNLGGQIKEFVKVQSALEALSNKSIDRLLFPHYLDLLYLMSDPNVSMPILSEIYIAKDIDKSFQIGMVLSHSDDFLVRNDDFYSCLEIMTSRFTAEIDYDYSRIDGSILEHAQDTFDTEKTLKYLYGILAMIGLMLIIGLGFDAYTLLRGKDKKKKYDSDIYMDELARAV